MSKRKTNSELEEKIIKLRDENKTLLNNQQFLKERTEKSGTEIFNFKKECYILREEIEKAKEEIKTLKAMVKK